RAADTEGPAIRHQWHASARLSGRGTVRYLPVLGPQGVGAAAGAPAEWGAGDAAPGAHRCRDRGTATEYHPTDEGPPGQFRDIGGEGPLGGDVCIVGASLRTGIRGSTFAGSC